MKQDSSLIVFVCEHGAAKSVIAAAYFNKLASDGGLHFRAIARGTDPDPELSPKAVAGLQADGLVSAERIPQKLTVAEVKSVAKIVTFCELPGEFRNVASEQWDGVPPVSENYEQAKDVIVERIIRLLKSL